MWGPVVRRQGLRLLRGCRSGRDVLADWTREPGPGRQQECCHLRERLWLICAAALTGRAEAKACRGGRGTSPRHTERRVMRRRNPAPLTGSMSSLCHEKGDDMPKQETLALQSGSVLLCSKICWFLRGPLSHDEGLSQNH